MSDLINREVAIDEVLTFFVEYCGGAFDEDNQRLLAQRMNSLPSVDITETEVCQKCQETIGRVLANSKGINETDRSVAQKMLDELRSKSN